MIGCGVCHDVLAELKVVNTELMERPKRFSHIPSMAFIRCDLAEELCSMMKVDSYPTLFAFSFGIPPLVELEDINAVHNFIAQGRRVYGCLRDPSDRAHFYDISSKHNGLFNFGILSLDKSEQLCHHQYLLITDSLGNQSKIGWSRDLVLEKILSSRYFPSILSYSSLDNSLIHHVLNEIPICAIFYLNYQDKLILEERVKNLLHEFKYKVIFLFANWIEAESLSREFMINEPISCALPLLSIGILDKNMYFTYPGCGMDILTCENIKGFINEVMDGKVAPSSRSEERLPDSEKDFTYGSCEDDGVCLSPLNKITHDTFEREVLKSSRTAPILVQLYADWCQECKTFDTTFKKLATTLGNKAKFVSLNVDFNDIPLQSGIAAKYTKLPQLYLYPRNPLYHSCENLHKCTTQNASIPIRYDGPLENTEILAFIKKFVYSEHENDNHEHIFFGENSNGHTQSHDEI